MFLVSRPSKRFSTSSLRTARVGQGRCGLPPARPPARPCPGGGQPHSLVHVERQGDVLVLGEKQDEEVVASLTLLDGRVQADLQGGRTDRVQRQPGLGDPAGELDGRGRQLPPEDPAGPSSPRRTSGAGPCGAAGRAVAPWCRGSCSLAVQVQGGGVDADVIVASGSQTLQLPEDAEASPVAWITFTFDSTFCEKASTGSTLSSWVGGT